jgi:hypothetical protein
MAVLLEKLDLEIGAGVQEIAGWECYGIVASRPYTDDAGTLIEVDFGDDQQLGGVWPYYPDLLKRTPSCECGNPFVLCHPEA